MLGCFLLFMTTIFSQNKKSYQDLLDKIQNFEAGQEVQAKQGRRGVQKEIWYNKGGQRLQVVISGDSAHVHYEKSTDRKEIVEQLTDVTVIMQEEVIRRGASSEQKLKRIKAAEAAYNYSSQLLMAKDVYMEEMLVPGEQIPGSLPSPEYTVHADWVEVQMVEGKLEVDVVELDANLEAR